MFRAGSRITSSSSSCSARPIGGRRVAERDQVVARDRKVAQPVRALQLARRRPGGTGEPLERRACAASSALAAEVGLLVIEQLERQPAAVPRRASAAPAPGRCEPGRTCARERFGSRASEARSGSGALERLRERGRRSPARGCGRSSRASRSSAAGRRSRARRLRLAEVVEQRREPHRERRAAVAAACTTAKVCSSTVRSW